MNRSILIVICDFLLLSLLTFSTPDLSSIGDEHVERRVPTDLAVNSPENRQDMATLMKLALDDEQRTREVLSGELKQTRENLKTQQTNLLEREQVLAEKNRLIQEQTQNLRTREQQLSQLAQEKSRVEQQFATTQTNLQTLRQQYDGVSARAMVAGEKAAANMEQLLKEQARAAALQEQLSQLEKSNQLARAEKEQLASKLAVVETEKRAAAEQAARMQDEVKVVREEKARLNQTADKLADGVKALATHSDEIVHEMRENRPLAANVIFQDFSTNRIHLRFNATRSLLLGLDQNRKRETEAILVTEGTNYYVLCHAEDTAVNLVNPAPDWLSLTGTMGREAGLYSINGMTFSALDPRVVIIPISAAEAKGLGCKPYRTAQDPFKFQDAVLVGAREGYYGECRFQIELALPNYVKMDRSFVRGLFGKFNPSRGDLVFSKSGELLGIMANNTYCVRLLNFYKVASIPFGLDLQPQHVGDVLSRLGVQVMQMPVRLQ